MNWRPIQKLLFINAFLSIALQTAVAIPIQTPAARAAKEDPVTVELNAGLSALKNKQLAAAESAFHRAATMSPTAFAPLVGLAQVATQRNQSKDAETWLRKAEQVAPQVAEVQLAWGRYHASQKNFSAAENAYKKAIEFAPKTLPPRIELADFYLNTAKRPTAAVDTYKAIIELSPNYGPAHYGLAVALSVANERDKAIAEFEKAATLLPRDPMPLHSLARLYISRDDNRAALETLDRVLKIRPNYFPAFLDRGDIYMKTNNQARAIVEYNAAVGAEPKNSTALVRLGTVYLLQKRWSEAENAFKRAITSDPKPAVAYNNLAWLALAKKSNLDEALTWAKKATDMEPNSSAFYDTLGWIYRARGNSAEALRVLEKAVSLNPPDAGAFYHLGIIRSEQGRKEDALNAFRRALEIEPDFSDAADAQKRIANLSAR